MKIETDKYTIYNADCFEVLKSMPENSVDAVVTDPPYGLSFMGKKWDYDVPKVNGEKANGIKNFHPTVKPIKLMEYLIKLVTPADGIVIDPFMGSGSTGVAAMNLKRKFIGIEMMPEYFQIAEARIEKALGPGEIFKQLPN